MKAKLNKIFICALFLLCGCVNHTNKTVLDNSEPNNHTYRIIKDLVYTPNDWPQTLKADIYQPDSSEMLPAVLVVHGGGWEGRSREDMVDICIELAKAGFVAINISYRFAPDYIFPAQIYDLQQAMHWIHSNTKQFNIDPERLGAYGFSSGAHLVLMLAMLDSNDELDHPNGGNESRLKAVVGGGSPTDLRKFKGGKLVPQFLGTTIDESPETFALASPVLYVDKDDPPTFLYHGSLDRLVEVSHAKDMNAELDRVGVKSELYIVNYLGHITLFILGSSAVEAAITFLKDQL